MEHFGLLGAWAVSLMNSEIEDVINTPRNTKPRINAPITSCRFSATVFKPRFVAREDSLFDSVTVMSRRAMFDYS